MTTSPDPAGRAWLSAAAVAAMAAEHGVSYDDAAAGVNDGLYCRECLGCWPCEAARLAAQDARWRALVGALLAAFNEDGAITQEWTAQWGPEPVPSARLREAFMQAQAALDGAAPPTRESSDG